MSATPVDETENAEKSGYAGPQDFVENAATGVPVAPAQAFAHGHTGYDGSWEGPDRETNKSGSSGVGEGNVDAMDVDKETAASPARDDFGLESLQKNFTSAFHLCKSCKASLTSIPTVTITVVATP